MRAEVGDRLAQFAARHGAQRGRVHDHIGAADGKQWVQVARARAEGGGARDRVKGAHAEQVAERAGVAAGSARGAGVTAGGCRVSKGQVREVPGNIPPGAPG